MDAAVLERTERGSPGWAGGSDGGEGPAAAPVVVHVEDEPGLRELYGMVLEHAGYRVVGAESALGARGLVRRLRPAAIVLDLGLPFVSGARFLAELRADQDPAVREVPVVVVSALTETLPRERREQVSAVLGKPVPLEVLTEAVHAAVGR